jgi:thioredoxin reductase (NADPH)
MDIQNYDYIIIGAGPAGLAGAQYAARGGLKTLVLDSGSTQVLQISELENYPGVFPFVNGADFMEKMKSQAESFGAKIVIANVTSIDKTGSEFVVSTSKKLYKAPYVCLATGAVHKNLGIPGEKEFTGRGVSYCAVCDGPFFKNKKIFVVGGGDSACSEAIYLSTISNDVKIIHRRDSFRAQKAVSDKMIAKGVVPVFDTVVKSINGSSKVESLTLQNVKTGQIFEEPADAVFIFTGMIPQNNLVEILKKDENGYILTDEKMETSMPGLFAAGDIRSKSFRQVVTAVSDGAVAAHTVCELFRK